MIELKMTRAEAMRQQRGLLMRELADQSGISRCNLNMKLNGHGGMRSSKLKGLADALGWDGDPAELLEEVKLYRRIELWGEGFDWFDLKRWKEPLVRHTYADGGNFITDFAVTITPDQKNEWTFQIPNPEVLPQE